jgi:hypothetical protein
MTAPYNTPFFIYDIILAYWKKKPPLRRFRTIPGHLTSLALPLRTGKTTLVLYQGED